MHGLVTLANDGCLYGTTLKGGIYGAGAVFRVTTNGILTTLVSFGDTNSNGTDPNSLTLGNDGNLYGTSQHGGIDGHGTIFQVTTNGILTTLVSFADTNSNGAYPNSLTLGNDGNFYGTSRQGGIDGHGTIFQVTTNGILTTLVHCYQTAPYGALTLGKDGNFYGISTIKTSGYNGTIFRLLVTPNFTVQPQSQTKHAGATVMFFVRANGLNPVSYQWQKNGTNCFNGGNVSGANTSTLTISNLSHGDAASYSVTISNSFGRAVSSNAVLTVNDSLFIASQPQNQTIGLGSNVTFNVTVYGASPLLFQWYFNETPLGSPVSGTNYSAYTLNNVGTNQSGNYSVKVVNGHGSLVSFNAALTVKLFPPGIDLQPLDQRVMIGSCASFNVSVTGTPPFHYQWKFNGANLLNATNAAYGIEAVAATNTGSYSVLVTNWAGSVTSYNALLTVIVPPKLTFQVWADYPLLGLSGMISNNFVVQGSTNLAGTNWANLLSLTNLPFSPYLFLDPGGIGQPARFYRAVLVP